MGVLTASLRRFPSATQGSGLYRCRNHQRCGELPLLGPEIKVQLLGCRQYGTYQETGFGETKTFLSGDRRESGTYAATSVKSPSRTLSGWATRLSLGIWVTDMPVVACYGD